MTLPAAYAWLQRLEPLPRMVSEGIALLGTIETPGKANNPKIMAWAREVKLERIYTGDEVPWCGLFMAVVAKRAGKPIPDGPLWALNWGAYGVKAFQPALGDVLTFIRPGGGHVGLYIAEDQTAYHVLGGNQADSVSITRITKTRMRAARRSVYTVQPWTVRPYIVASTGKISTNEA